MEHKHTELPWLYQKRIKDGKFYILGPYIEGRDGSGIIIPKVHNEANAAFIVKACNEHHKRGEVIGELLELVKDYKMRLESLKSCALARHDSDLESEIAAPWDAVISKVDNAIKTAEQFGKGD